MTYTKLISILVWLSCTCVAHAASLETRVGVHPTFDRVVFTIGAGIAYTTQRDGDGVVLHFPSAGSVPGVARRAGRVRGVAGGIDTATISVVHDATIRVWRLDGRVVVDVFAPDAARSDRAPITANTALVARETAAAPIATQKFSREAATADRLAPAGPQNAAPLSAVPQAVPPPDTVFTAARAGPPPPDPSSLAVTLLAPDPAQASAAILVPFAASVGAAAFRRGDTAYAVFDAARTLDLGGIATDTVFGTARAELLPSGTVLRLKLPREAELRLERRPEGWVVRASRAAAPLGPILAHPENGKILLDASTPGRSLIVQDPSTGGRLLVGTQITAGEHVAAGHSSPEFALWPTWQGVLVEPACDTLDLYPVKSGFALVSSIVVTLGGGWRDTISIRTVDASALTRSFDFPSLPPPMLRLRLRDALRDAASLPKLNRFDARMRVAQAMLALGMGVEANAVLQAAAEDDPARSGDPTALSLASIAAWLAGRTDAQTAESPPLPASDEGRLWQAVLQSGRADAGAAAASFAITWPLIMTYPERLRAGLLATAAETMARGGQAAMFDALLGASGDPSLDLLRAEALRRSGKIDDALVLLDRITNRPDRKMRAQARRAATELRLAAHRIDTASAADLLAKQLYAWRGDAQERALRLRIAVLKSQQGDWRAAMTMLRETDLLFPEAHNEVHAAEIALLTDLLHGDAASRMQPLELAALADECTGLLAETEDGAKLAPVLVDKLLALELPDRAEPILRDMLDKTEASVPKAELGWRLAALRLDHGDVQGAGQALDISAAPGLNEDLAGRRDLLHAKVVAASGDVDTALAELGRLQSADSFDLQAKLLERRQRWAQAAAALASAVERFVPASGFLDEPQQNLLLRLAGDLSQAGDMAALRQLQARFGDRFAGGGRAALFRVLTQKPVQDVADLPRAEQDLVAAQSLPASLAAIKPP